MKLKYLKNWATKKRTAIPIMVTMSMVFAASIASAMTPISHPLIVLGMNFYQQTLGQPINLVSYMLYAVPIGIPVFAAMLVMLRLLFKPDMSKIMNFDINSVLDKSAPMPRREKITVITFFGTVIMWILPAVLPTLAPHFALRNCREITHTSWLVYFSDCTGQKASM